MTKYHFIDQRIDFMTTSLLVEFLPSSRLARLDSVLRLRWIPMPHYFFFFCFHQCLLSDRLEIRFLEMLWFDKYFAFDCSLRQQELICLVFNCSLFITGRADLWHFLRLSSSASFSFWSSWGIEVKWFRKFISLLAGVFLEENSSEWWIESFSNNERQIGSWSTWEMFVLK